MLSTTNYDIKDTLSLEELIVLENLTVRSINVCRSKNLDSITDILDFYQENYTFLNIRNCGAKSEQELVDLCFKYKDLKPSILTPKTEYLKIIQDLMPFQKRLLLKHFEYLINKLSVRAFNGLCSLCEKISSKSILEALFLTNVNLGDVPNIGKKTLKELNLLKAQTAEFINVFMLLPKEKLSKEYTRLILETNIFGLKVNYDEILDEFGRLKLFQLIDVIVKSDNIFNKNEKAVFSNSYTIANDGKSNLDNLAETLGLTRERIRQIKVKIEEEMHTYFAFIQNFGVEDIVSYKVLSSTDDLIIIDDTYTKDINTSENVYFTTSFYCLIFGLILKESHSILRSINLIKGRKLPYRQGTLNFYLISNTLKNVFSFEDLIISVNDLLNERITETYELQFDGYLFQFGKNEFQKVFQEIKSVSQSIVFNEFDMLVNFEGYLIFERNVKKQLSDYCFEILSEFSKPMLVEEMEVAINNKFPDVNALASSIRGTLQREKERFISFGRTSTYALREWENERENFKGGTIREMVYEFLLTQSTPIHISIIAKHVELFRGTTYAVSVLSNLKSDETNRFLFLEGSFIGLHSKNYNKSDLLYKRLIGSHFNKVVLTKYNGWDVKKFIQVYSQKYGYREVQLDYLLKNKVDDGEIFITRDNKLII